MATFDGMRKKVEFFESYNPDEDWPSIVLLFREPRFPTPEDAIAIGRSVWGEKQPIELIAVKEDPSSFVILHANLVFAFHCTQGRYDVQRAESTAVQENAWSEHKAWFAIDLPQKRTARLREINDLGACYRFLLVFASKLWTPNCPGIYFPSEQVLLPNVGDFVECIRWAGRNGLDLRFLK